MIRRPPRSTLSSSSAASDVYKRQPVVMSNFSYWQEIFKDCALFVDPYDSKDIAEKILYLLDNPDEAKELGKKGRKLIEEKYSWEAESKKLLEMYKNL